MRMHYCQTQSRSNSGVHDVAPGNKQLLAQVGARGCSKEGTVMGRGRVVLALPLPELLSSLTCGADDGTMVVYARAVGVPAGGRGPRARGFCRASPGVELPDGQGEANGQQQQGSH